MVRSIVLSLVTAACFSAFTWLDEIPVGAFGRASTGIALGTLATALVYGSLTWTTVVMGAFSPLLFTWILPLSFPVAVAAMCSAWLVPRLLLTISRQNLIVLIAVSIAVALAAGWAIASYVSAPLPVHAASCVFAGACVSLVSFVVPVQTTASYALHATAAIIDEPIAASLRRAAEMHQETKYLPSPRATRKQWQELVTLADRRAALQGVPGDPARALRKKVDVEIETALAALLPSSDLAAMATALTPIWPPADDSETHEAVPTEAIAPQHEDAPEDPHPPTDEPSGGVMGTRAARD